MCAPDCERVGVPDSTPVDVFNDSPVPAREELRTLYDVGAGVPVMLSDTSTENAVPASAV